MTRFLVTGAMGCLGAWTIRELVARGDTCVAADLSDDRARLRAIMTDDQLAAVAFERLDITDGDAVERAVVEHGVSHVIHLAALQIPFCRADPVLGSRVNVTGTTTIFEAAARHRDLVQRVVYTSSAAVYGPPDRYLPGPVPADAPPFPESHYGVYKVANEGTARVYAAERGVSSIGLRPYIVYGVGRDQGATSVPTRADPRRGARAAGHDPVHRALRVPAGAGRGPHARGRGRGALRGGRRVQRPGWRHRRRGVRRCGRGGRAGARGTGSPSRARSSPSRPNWTTPGSGSCSRDSRSRPSAMA